VRRRRLDDLEEREEVEGKGRPAVSPPGA
jgi:hypothetical protein